MNIDMDKEVVEGLEIVADKVAEEAAKAEKKLEKGAVSGYHKIEETIVGGYHKIEDTVVGGFNKVADGFVNKFFAKEGETAQEAKARMLRETEERQAAIQADMDKRREQQEKLIGASLRMSAAINEEATKYIRK